MADDHSKWLVGLQFQQFPAILLCLLLGCPIFKTIKWPSNHPPPPLPPYHPPPSSPPGIDGGKDIDGRYLADVYARICQAPLTPCADHVVQVAKVDHMIIGHHKPVSGFGGFFWRFFGGFWVTFCVSFSFFLRFFCM